MSARLQLEKEIREAIVFLREKNQTIPSDTIEFMKVASLEKLNSIPDIDKPRVIVLGRPETIGAFMKEVNEIFEKAIYCTGMKTGSGKSIKIGDKITGEPNRIVVLNKNEQPESFWGEIRAEHQDGNILNVDAWQTPDDNEEGTVIATINMKTLEVEYLDKRAERDNYAQEVILGVLNSQRIANSVGCLTIIDILMRKKKGIDCTEQESAEIKGYLKELKRPEEQQLVAEIQQWFPQEYGEYLDETGE